MSIPKKIGLRQSLGAVHYLLMFLGLLSIVAAILVAVYIALFGETPKLFFLVKLLFTLFFAFFGMGISIRPFSSSRLKFGTNPWNTSTLDRNEQSLQFWGWHLLAGFLFLSGSYKFACLLLQ